MCVLLLPYTLLSAWVGLMMLFHRIPWGVLFIVLSVLLLVGLLYLTTFQVTITRAKLVRTWWLGTRDIFVCQITRLYWTSARGEKNLHVVGTKGHISLPAFSLPKHVLVDIHDRLLAMTEGVAHGKTGVGVTG